MKPTSIAAIVCATLVAMGTAYWIDAREAPRKLPYPKATPPPPASNVFHESKEPVPDADAMEEYARERPAQLQAGIEEALHSRNSQQLEAAFTFLLPELLQIDPDRLVAMVAGMEPGGRRDLLRDELARQWIGRDPEAAMRWMDSLTPESAQRAAVKEAMDVVAHIDVTLAGTLAKRFAAR